MEKIRIFSLAKELGLDNKALIDYCQRLGIVVKNSALASITPEERDRVVDLIKNGQKSTSAPPAKVEPQAPVREAPKVVSTKVPPIKTMAPRPQLGREPQRVPEAETVSTTEPASSSEATASPELAADDSARTVTAVEEASETPVTSTATAAAPVSPAAATVTPDVEPPAAMAAVTEQPETETASPDSSRTSTEAPSRSTTTAAVTAPSETDAGGSDGTDVSEAPAPSTSGSAVREPVRVPPPPAIRREDYMPASGTTRAKFSPEGGGDAGRGAAPKKPKGRPGPALPMLAAPPPPPKTFAPAKASTDAPAQKPDMRFSKEAIERGKPLQEHLRQNLEDKKKKKRPDGEEVATDLLGDRKTKAPGGKAPLAGPVAGGGGLISERKSRQARRSRPGMTEDEEAAEAMRARASRHRGKRPSMAQSHLKSSAEIEFPITVRSLSEALGRPANQLIRVLMMQGSMVTINSSLEEDQALALAMELGVDLQIKREKDLEDDLLEVGAETGGERVIRAPIITIMGHVDHGKTTLLDKIRSANVAAGEVGGITQHIAAYQVEHNGRKITFLDTPGHAAFGEMRARGANVTDIAVLVVAANDGVMPQTIEALNHARAAEVPIVVAMNKIDLPEKNEQRVLQDLAAQNLLAAEWGGDTEVVRTSGATGLGLDDLLETLLTVADLNELTADPTRDAVGVCLEAFRDEGRGALVWLIVQDGTLRKGDIVLCGPAYGRIRSMYDDKDREVDEVGPSTPVKVAGLDMVPGAGDKFYVVEDLEKAREIAETRRFRGREVMLSSRGRPQRLEEILKGGDGQSIQELPIIIKGDTPGSVEALKGELGKFSHPEVRINLLHEGVGGVNESDVYLASASGAIIIAFHVVAEDRANELAEREGVEIRPYQIIYEITDDIKKALEGLLRPERVEVMTGRALVLQLFTISRFGTIAGCRVLNGVIERSNRVRVIRDQRILNDYNIQSLRRNKDDAKEVREGQECGIRLEHFDDVKEGDILQAYKIQENKRTLE